MTKKLLIIFFTLLITFSLILGIKHKDKIKNFFNNETEYIKEIDKPNKYQKNYKEITTFKEIQEVNINNKEDIIKLYYTLLNRGITNFSFACPEEYENCTKDAKEIANNIETLSHIDNYINPLNSFHYFHITIINDKDITIEVDKIYSQEEIKNIETKTNEIINELNINNTPNEEDIKKIHDYLIRNIKYDDNYKNKENKITDSNKATGALLKGISVCSGYADAFAIILDKINIPNFMISNDDHIWNVIYLNNEWKHIDITWDDDEDNINNTTNFFMLTNEELQNLKTNEHNYNINLYKEIN